MNLTQFIGVLIAIGGFIGLVVVFPWLLLFPLIGLGFWVYTLAQPEEKPESAKNWKVVEEKKENIDLDDLTT